MFVFLKHQISLPCMLYLDFYVFEPKLFESNLGLGVLVRKKDLITLFSPA